MPDIDFQKIELNLIPKQGDEPVVFYASQYETARPFIADLFWGESEFAPGDDCWAEIDIRKVDDNLVVITDDVSIDNNVVSVVLPIQAVTCVGKNFGQIKIYADVDNLIASLNFILEVQPDPLANGVTSETAIDNLTTQIDDIISGEGYVKDTDLDVLQSDWDEADPTSPAYIKNKPSSGTQVQADWTEADTTSPAYILNKPDLKTVATSGSYNDLTDKPTIPDAQVQSDWNQADSSAVDYIKNKPDLILVRSATANPASFNTDLTDNLVSVKANIPYNASGYTGGVITRTGANVFDEEFEIGTFDTTTGANIDYATSQIRTKNLIPVVGGQSYYFKSPLNTGLGEGMWCMFLDRGQNVITPPNPQSGNSIFVSNSAVTTPSNACYVKFYLTQGYGTTYNNDIAINYPSTDTEYHAYSGNAYTFDWSLDGTVYGGYLDVTNGSVVGTLNADGTEKATPDVYTLTATAIPALSGVNNVTSDLGGNVEVRYTSGDLAGQIIDICKMVIAEQGV